MTILDLEPKFLGQRHMIAIKIRDTPEQHIIGFQMGSANVADQDQNET